MAPVRWPTVAAAAQSEGMPQKRKSKSVLFVHRVACMLVQKHMFYTHTVVAHENKKRARLPLSGQHEKEVRSRGEGHSLEFRPLPGRLP